MTSICRQRRHHACHTVCKARRNSQQQQQQQQQRSSKYRLMTSPKPYDVITDGHVTADVAAATTMRATPTAEGPRDDTRPARLQGGSDAVPTGRAKNATGASDCPHLSSV